MGLKIILTGGGTMGSVTPLLAVAEEIKRKAEESEFLWLGTKNGPERESILSRQINFISIPSGKLRRYFSGWNLLIPFLILGGFVSSLFLILRFKPGIILSAGGFVGVPVIWAGWFLGVPSIIHQQDIRPGLANKLTAPFAKVATVAFSDSQKYFSGAIWTGNPVRREIFSGNKDEAEKIFGLEKNLPTLLVLGGGTGSLSLNSTVIKAVFNLTEFCQIIHVTGGRTDRQAKDKIEEIKGKNSRYHDFNFLKENLKHAYAAADLVVSRAGLGTLTEIASLGKPAILIPIPRSHQEDNARFFEKNNAAHILNQDKINPEIFSQAIGELINNKIELENLGRNIKQTMRLGAAGSIAEEVFKIIKK